MPTTTMTIPTIIRVFGVRNEGMLNFDAFFIESNDKAMNIIPTMEIAYPSIDFVAMFLLLRDSEIKEIFKFSVLLIVFYIVICYSYNG